MIIENFNRQLRKVTKAKTIFPTDDSLFKMLYLAMTEITKKWIGKPWNWVQVLEQLCIFFGQRLTPAEFTNNIKTEAGNFPLTASLRRAIILMIFFINPRGLRKINYTLGLASVSRALFQCANDSWLP